ncbi:MAG: VWA domain-containing protein [Chloroflexi bacterium]|nr:VWA domain-containing protein [Chloroflexota bacterium]
MSQLSPLAQRIGPDAADRVEPLLVSPPVGDYKFAPAPQDCCRGALVGAVFGESMPELLRGGLAGAGPNSRMTLIAGHAALNNPAAHPESFAAALVSANVAGTGRATVCARDALRRGTDWPLAGVPNSAGAAAAARATVFGLLFSGDPARAAFEAALSATVTHRHSAAIAGAAAVSAAVALAAQSDKPLGKGWLETVAEICSRFPQEKVYGQSVAGAIRMAADSLDGDSWPLTAHLGQSALCTHAIPAALLTAAAAPSPFGSSAPDRGDAVLATLSSLHEVSRAIAGACIGARGGRRAWMGREGLIASGSSDLIRTRSLADVLALADRIAGHATPRAIQCWPSANGGQGTPAVHVSFLIDRSGSMAPLGDDVVGGFNNFVADQRQQPGACSLTLVMFDSQDPSEVLIDDVPIANVPIMAPDQFRPRGTTPLLDALGALIKSIDKRCEQRGPETRDEDQIVVVFTDGMENSSRRWSRRELFELIDARKKSGWSFVFLGANQDSYSEAGHLGIDGGSIQDYRGDRDGVHTAFESVNRALGEYRSAGIHDRFRRRKAFFDGRKEAEDDHHRRTA